MLPAHDICVRNFRKYELASLVASRVPSTIILAVLTHRHSFTQFHIKIVEVPEYKTSGTMSVSQLYLCIRQSPYKIQNEHGLGHLYATHELALRKPCEWWLYRWFRPQSFESITVHWRRQEILSSAAIIHECKTRVVKEKHRAWC